MLRVVKPEIRVLGLSRIAIESKISLCLGVVFRPPNWVEGVLGGFYREEESSKDQLLKNIVNSSKYAQIRLVIIDQTLYREEADLAELSRKLGRPIIVFAEEGWRAFGVDNRSAEKVFELIGARPPEPLRIAKMLCQAVAKLVTKRK